MIKLFTNLNKVQNTNVLSDNAMKRMLSMTNSWFGESDMTLNDHTVNETSNIITPLLGDSVTQTKFTVDSTLLSEVSKKIELTQP